MSLYSNSNIWAFQEQFLLFILSLVYSYLFYVFVCLIIFFFKLGSGFNCGNSGN